FLGAALHVGRIYRSVDHRRDVQHLVVHGADYGHRHRGEERHSVTRCRSEVPRRRRAPRGSDDPRRRAPPASHHDDRARDGRRHDPAGARHRRRLANAATPGHRSDRRHSPLDGLVTGSNPGRAFLSHWPKSRRHKPMKKLFAFALIAAAACWQLYSAEGMKVLSKIKVGGAGGWDYLTMDPVNRKLYIAHGNKVDIVDPDAGK